MLKQTLCWVGLFARKRILNNLIHPQKRFMTEVRLTWKNWFLSKVGWLAENGCLNPASLTANEYRLWTRNQLFARWSPDNESGWLADSPYQQLDWLAEIDIDSESSWLMKRNPSQRSDWPIETDAREIQIELSNDSYAESRCRWNRLLTMILIGWCTDHEPTNLVAMNTGSLDRSLQPIQFPEPIQIPRRSSSRQHSLTHDIWFKSWSNTFIRQLIDQKRKERKFCNLRQFDIRSRCSGTEACESDSVN